MSDRYSPRDRFSPGRVQPPGRHTGERRSADGEREAMRAYAQGDDPDQHRYGDEYPMRRPVAPDVIEDAGGDRDYRTGHDMPTDPTMRMPLNQNPPRPRDLVVPRVYIEPDEDADNLRRLRDKWAIARDILMCLFLAVATYWLVASIVAGWRSGGTS